MGKNYCKVDKKWCKFCRHRGCIFSETNWQSTKTCPKRQLHRTISFAELIKTVNFYDVMTAMITYWPKQKKNVLGYASVFETLLKKKPKKSNIELLCKIEYFDNGGCCPCAYGKENGREYAIEYVPWSVWLGMNITQSTLDNLTPEVIVAGSLFEMTFNGYTEEDINQRLNDLRNSFEEIKNK